MSSNSKGQVPFAWENKPGIPKGDGESGGNTKLPPPPYLQSESGRESPVNLQNIPLPPCAFHSPISTRGDAYKEDADDPFLIAYKKCTNGGGASTTKLHNNKKKKRNSNLSCKSSCSVSDDSIVRISQLPIPKPTKEMIGSFFKFDD